MSVADCYVFRDAGHGQSLRQRGSNTRDDRAFTSVAGRSFKQKASGPCALKQSLALNLVVHPQPPNRRAGGQ